MTLSELDTLRRDGKVVACPVCGNEVMHHCWHEGMEEVSSEVMPVDVAISKVQASIVGLEEELETCRGQLSRYMAMQQEARP